VETVRIVATDICLHAALLHPLDLLGRIFARPESHVGENLTVGRVAHDRLNFRRRRRRVE